MSPTAAADARHFDSETVIHRLEEAGASLLALPGSGWSTKLRSSSLDIVKSAVESYGWTTSRIRPPIPSAGNISRMDEAMSWIMLIPLDRYVLRRIVGARSLVPQSPSAIFTPGDASRRRLARITRRSSGGMLRGST
jgi:hypothetical protein